MSFSLASCITERQLCTRFPKCAMLAHVVNTKLDANYTIGTPAMEMWLQEPARAQEIIIDWIYNKPSMHEHIMSYLSSVSCAYDYTLIGLVVYLIRVLISEPNCVSDVDTLCATMRSIFFVPVEEVEDPSTFYLYHNVGKRCRN